MSELRERIIANIRSEARNLIKRDVPMPDRDPRWNDLKAKILIEERELYEKEIEAKHMADYESMNASLQKAYSKANNGMPYDEWLTKAKKLYSIEGSSVISIAKGPKNTDTVNTGSKWQAEKRVLKLIYTKYNDHFNRGYDFMWDPDGEENK